MFPGCRSNSQQEKKLLHAATTGRLTLTLITPQGLLHLLHYNIIWVLIICNYKFLCFFSLRQIITLNNQ